MVATGVLILGFGGVSTQVDVKYGSCESHFREYQMKPFLVSLVCLTGKIKPCGDFVEHKNQMLHIEMLECLCRDPSNNVSNLREYTSRFLPHDNLGTEASAICQARPRRHSL